MQTINIGLLGLGTVSSGVVNVINNNKLISQRAGCQLNITTASIRNLKQPRDCDTNSLNLTDDPTTIIDDPTIDIVVELIGGTTDALTYVLRAIDNGKHIITANKALIAEHGNTIFKRADEKGVLVLFEAAVAGGIPIIKTLREGLAANQIHCLAGILNGTSNYILTAMQQEQREFSDVLASAQQLGYAEAEPSLDVDGIDAAHKLTILSALAFAIPLQLNTISTQGIRNITLSDLRYATELGFTIKHLGFARKHTNSIELRVHPTCIPTDCLLAHVNGVMNSVWVNSDALGHSLYYGAGAGMLPTASSVVADLIDMARAMQIAPAKRIPPLLLPYDALTNTPIISEDAIQTRYYIRLLVRDQTGVLANITQILGQYQVSIEAILQKDRLADTDFVYIIILTHPTSGKAKQAALTDIAALAGVKSEILAIPVETDVFEQ